MFNLSRLIYFHEEIFPAGIAFKKEFTLPLGHFHKTCPGPCASHDDINRDVRKSEV